MPEAVIVSAARTAIGTAYKGTLTETTPEQLAEVVIIENLTRSGVDPALVDDIVLAESLGGGGDVARYAAVHAGLNHVPGQAVNRHCTGGLTAVQVAAGSIRSGMDRAIIAGGTQSTSLTPQMTRRVPGSTETDPWMPHAHPHTAEAPALDMSITVGWNTARLAGLTREQMDAWALRSHERAIAAIDAGKFADEIVAIKALRPDGSYVDFGVDEHPRRGSTMDKLAGLKVLHPEIEGFSITAGNSSGLNDAAAAVTVVADDLATSQNLERMATIHAWANTADVPVRNGLAVLDVIPKVLQRAGRSIADVKLWEINEAFASVPVAVCRDLGIDEDIVNTSGSGCSLGHPIAASGARMLATMIYELRRLGGGIGVATMCAGGGQAGAMLIEVH